eukprot:9051847-Lingulodinium_polyedra.AAC.1
MAIGQREMRFGREVARRSVVRRGEWRENWRREENMANASLAPPTAGPNRQQLRPAIPDRDH